MPRPTGRGAVDIRQLEYFIAVARLRSYTKAADELFITRQALSKAVHNLEQELGETLIAQRDGTLEPTETGRTLMADAQPVVDVYRALERRYLGEAARGERMPLLSVSLVPGAATHLTAHHHRPLRRRASEPATLRGKLAHRYSPGHGEDGRVGHRYRRFGTAVPDRLRRSATRGNGHLRARARGQPAFTARAARRPRPGRPALRHLREARPPAPLLHGHLR